MSVISSAGSSYSRAAPGPTPSQGPPDVILDNVRNPSTSDGAPTIQAAINNLRATGGIVGLRGLWTVNSQIVLYPGIGLVGSGPLAAFTARGTTLFSTFAGSTILMAVDPTYNLSSFPWIANMTILGTGAVANQNGVEVNDSSGTMLDAYMDEVLIFQMGQHCIALNAASMKLWIRSCYLENSGGDGINHTGGFLNCFDSYVHGNSGRGVFTNGGAAVRLRGNDINSNTLVGIFQQSMTADCEITNNRIANNGSNANPQVSIRNWNMITNPDTGLTVVGNNFTDDRAIGAAAVYHMQFGGNPLIARGIVNDNTFGPGTSSGVPLLLVPATTGRNKLIIEGNQGLNDAIGKIATPFQGAGATATVGIEGTAAAPTASTTYVVSGTPVYIASSAGVAVSITIADPAGNALQTGLATFAGLLPPGYSINFGAFTGAPTVIASVA